MADSARNPVPGTSGGHSLRAGFAAATLQADPNGGWLYEVRQPGPPCTGVAELLFVHPPKLDPMSLGSRLSEAGHDVSVRLTAGGVCVVEFPRLHLEAGDRRVPARVFVGTAGIHGVIEDVNEGRPDEVITDPYLVDSSAPHEQRRAQDLARTCHHAVRILEENDGMPGGHRLELLATVARAAVEAFRPVILSWRSAHRLIEVDAFLEATGPFRLDRMALLATSVRQLELANPEPGQPAWVVDTVGLSDFGLPEVQLRCDRRPREAALTFVLATATTLWKRGVFADHGELLRAGSAHSELPQCRLSYQSALMAPYGRRVLDLEPIPTVRTAIGEWTDARR